MSAPLAAPLSRLTAGVSRRSTVLLAAALAGLLFTPSAKSMFAFGILVLVLLFRPQGILGKRLT